jgi:alpha-amylase
VRGLFFLLAALALAGSPLPVSAAPPIARPWNQDVIYFALTDRFYDGDPGNDVPAGSDPKLYDRTQTDIDRYHGGDFRGLELALQAGYFNDLGVTALWITPPVRNVWYSAYDAHDAPKTGYHGYWAQDFLDLDPHLVSRRSLDGSRAYADSRDGRMQHYKDLVALAHSRGIKVIQDIVCHHAGPVFYYDANGNGKFDRDQKSEWIEPFRADGPYPDARWAETPEWDQHRAAPAGPVTILGREVKTTGAIGDLASYGRRGMSADSLGKSDGEEIACDFFALRDFWTAPANPHFDELVNDFVEIYAFYAEEIGVDGFRIDTVKHVDHAFWDAFTERLRRRLGPERAKTLILFGEIYDGSPAKVGEYTYRLDWPRDRGPCLDSVLDFPFCYAARAYLRTGPKPFGPATDLAAALRSLLPVPHGEDQRPYYNPAPGNDGLNSEQKIVNFVENHDGLNRFRVQGVSERRNLLANALLLLSPGIPCLYYGTEAGLQDKQGRAGADAETGRMTFIHAGDIENLASVEKQGSFQGIASLCALRRELPALTAGGTSPLRADGAATNEDDGVFAFARGGDDDRTVPVVVVVVNASGEERATGAPGNAIKLVSATGKPLVAPGDRLERMPIAGLDAPGVLPVVPPVEWREGVPRIALRVGPESVNVYRRVR